MADATKYTSKLTSSHVLIIGGTSGIGYCVAEASLEAGMRVSISSSNPTRVESSIQRLLKTYPSASSRLAGHACDLSSPDLERNIAALLEKVGELDHIVFTAGEPLKSIGLKDVTLESIQQGTQIRLIAPILVAKHAAAYLSPGPRSSITLTTGTASERPLPGWVVPGAMLAASHSAMRSLALEMGPVRVNLVSPGAVETELWDGLSKEQLEAFRAGFKETSLTGTIGRPEDVAEAYLYCMRDWNVTGSMIGSNSGTLLLGK